MKSPVSSRLLVHPGFFRDTTGLPRAPSGAPSLALRHGLAVGRFAGEETGYILI